MLGGVGPPERHLSVTRQRACHMSPGGYGRLTTVGPHELRLTVHEYANEVRLQVLMSYGGYDLRLQVLSHEV